MATRRWSANTVRRRLVELNRFAGWLVARRYLATRRGLGPEHPLFVSYRGRITHPHLFRHTLSPERR
jgi:hypothetical protein